MERICYSIHINDEKNKKLHIDYKNSDYSFEIAMFDGELLKAIENYGITDSYFYDLNFGDLIAMALNVFENFGEYLEYAKKKFDISHEISEMHPGDLAAFTKNTIDAMMLCVILQVLQYSNDFECSHSINHMKYIDLLSSIKKVRKSRYN